MTIPVNERAELEAERGRGGEMEGFCGGAAAALGKLAAGSAAELQLNAVQTFP
jgi:hypothetical protein